MFIDNHREVIIMNHTLKRFFTKFTTCTCAFALIIFTLGPELCLGQDTNYSNRIGELMNQGYPGDVAADQAAEELYHRDGLNGTGGIDGKLLHETKPAKPTCEHEWISETTKEPTCTNEGITTFTCSKCSKTYNEKIAKLEHDYVLVDTTKGTCQETAIETYKCSVCGDEMTKEGVLGEHVLVKNTEKSAEPTCTENGHSVSTCSICNEVVEEEVPALGHKFSTTKTIIKQPTCTDDGEQAYVCNRCGKTREEEVIPALGHKESTTPIITKVPTFFTEGLEEHRCERCGTVLNTITLASKGGILRYIIPISIIVLIGLASTVVLRKKKKQSK